MKTLIEKYGDGFWQVEKNSLLYALKRLKGNRLSVFVAQRLYKADKIEPTTRDIEEATGIDRSSAHKVYKQLIKEGWMEKPECVNCHKKIEVKKLHRHHIKPRRLKGEDKRENYLNVCKSCHNSLEPRT